MMSRKVANIEVMIMEVSEGLEYACKKVQDFRTRIQSLPTLYQSLERRINQFFVFLTL